VVGATALVCLDMAGTTVRDDGVVDEAFTIALTRAGIDLDDPRFEAARAHVLDTMGQSKADVFAGLLSPEPAAAATAEFARAYEAIVAQGRVLEIPGALEVMDELRSRGVKVCLTTGFAPSTRDALIVSLGWTDHIDLALSPADCGRGRPAPDMIFGAMEKLRVRDSRAVAVVGDTVSDLASGTAAGAGVVIGVLSGAHDEATLSAVPHTALIADVADLIEALEGQ
jgi:phosphoglycolate phosphatase